MAKFAPELESLQNEGEEMCKKSGGTRRSWRVWGVGSPNVGSGIRHFLAPSKEPHCNTVSENKLDRLGLSRSLRLQESEMAENPDFLLLETLFSPSARAASSVPPASSPMPVQATTYTFNSPLLPTLNKDNGAHVWGGCWRVVARPCTTISSGGR